jgi:hypothetical protein
VKGKTNKDAVRDNLVTQLNAAKTAGNIEDATISISGEVTREGMAIKYWVGWLAGIKEKNSRMTIQMLVLT